MRSNSNGGYGLPLLTLVSGSSIGSPTPRRCLFILERRIDPFFRPIFDKLFRRFLTNIARALINVRRRDNGLKLAEERIQPNEKRILTTSSRQWVIRCAASGNRGISRVRETPRRTASSGVRSPFRQDMPKHMRRGLFAQPRTYRAWVRFSGPGPYITPDIDEGFMSISIKLITNNGPSNAFGGLPCFFTLGLSDGAS